MYGLGRAKTSSLDKKNFFVHVIGNILTLTATLSQKRILFESIGARLVNWDFMVVFPYSVEERLC